MSQCRVGKPVTGWTLRASLGGVELPAPALLMSRTASLLLVFAFFPATVAASQVDFPKPAPLPPFPEAPVDPLEAPLRPSFWEGEQGRVVSVWQRFEGEEEFDKDLFEDYLAELRGFGIQKPRGFALRALDSTHFPTVDLAARLLEYVGSAEDALVLVDTAASIGQVKIAATCLESARRLQNGNLPPSAVRLLAHPRRNLRIAVESRLADRVSQEHVLELLRLLEFGRDADTRLRAGRLLDPFADQERVRTALVAALADASVAVAFQAAKSLAGPVGADPAILRAQILNTSIGPGLGCLFTELLTRQESLGHLLVTSKLLPVLRQAFHQPDIFLSGAAAACLAEYEFRAEDPGFSGVEDALILHSLVRAVAGTRFYPQFSRFAPVGEHSLERITGVPMQDKDRRAWLTWFEANHEGFSLVRSSMTLRTSDVLTLRLVWQAGGGLTQALIGTEADPVPEAEARWFSTRTGEQLRSLLMETGILDVDVLPGVFGDIQAPLLAKLEIQVGNHRKPFAFHRSAEPAWLAGFLEELNLLWAQLSWQEFAPSDAQHEFSLAHLPAWERADSSARRSLVRDWVRQRLSLISDAALARWAREERLLAPLLDPLSPLLLQEAAQRRTNTELAMLLLRVAVATPDATLLQPLLEAGAAFSEPQRSDFLLAGLASLGTSVAASCLEDARLEVRVAAARALGRCGPTAQAPLLTALQDSHPLVVRMAARSLGDLGDSAAVPALLERVSPDQPKSVRAEAISALGRLGDARALEAVLAAAGNDEEPAVRIAAIRALAALDGGGAESALSGLFPTFAAGPLESVFIRAIEERGGGSARRILTPHLRAFDSSLSYRAAVGMGRLGEARAAETLMQALPDSPRDPELLAALAVATATDFRDMPDPAGVWTAWWRENGRLSGEEWLQQVAADAGVRLPAGFSDPTQIPAKETVAALVKWMETAPAHLRPVLALHLQELTGLDSPAMTEGAPREIFLAGLATWRTWLSS